MGGQELPQIPRATHSVTVMDEISSLSSVNEFPRGDCDVCLAKGIIRCVQTLHVPWKGLGR